MNTKAKALLIPIAAFAVTVTGVQAFNTDVLKDAGLSDDEVAAFEVARELRQEGDREGARDVLIEAGIDLETMQTVREAMHEHRAEMKTAIDEAVEAEDYEAFLEAIAGSPLADIITSEDDFDQFVTAHNLRAEGEYEEARAIMEDLGMESGPKGFGKGHGKGKMDGQGIGHYGGLKGGMNR